jgi:S1-C subfamily serine protease
MLNPNRFQALGIILFSVANSIFLGSDVLSAEVLPGDVLNQAIENTVIEVISAQEPITGRPGDERAGSGTLLKAVIDDKKQNPYLLTNTHVYLRACNGVAGCQPIILLASDKGTLPGQSLEPWNRATMVDVTSEKEEDITLLKLIDKRNSLLSAAGSDLDNKGTPKLGEVVYVAGYPGSISRIKKNTQEYKLVPMEILDISDSLNRMVYKPTSNQNVEDGMSGGPVLNIGGFIVGISVEKDIQTDRRLGVPVSTICRKISALSEHCLRPINNSNPLEKFPNGGSDSSIFGIFPIKGMPSKPVIGLW